MDVGERDRAYRLNQSMPQFEHEFPLIDHMLTKQDCHGICERLGVKRPAMYDLGYQNNNCIGCVKGGMGYWNKIRVDFPEVFKKRAATMKGSVTKDYSAYKISTGSGSQDLALVFGEGVDDEKYVDFKVTWVQHASVKVIKKDADAGNTVQSNYKRIGIG